MRTDNTQRRRRGGRRHQRGSRNETGAKPVASRRKPGFWARLFAFFTGGRNSNKQQKPTAASAERPARASANVEPRPARKPELMEVTTPKVYVGNLSFDALESDLFELFSGVGSVQNAEIVSHRETQKSKGFGFVTMASVDEAKRAVAELHDKEFLGRKLVISGAKTTDAR